MLIYSPFRLLTTAKVCSTATKVPLFHTYHILFSLLFVTIYLARVTIEVTLVNNNFALTEAC